MPSSDYYRTVEEGRILDLLAVSGWAHELRTAPDAARDAARETLERLVASGLPFRRVDARTRTYDPAELINFAKMLGLRNEDDFWEQRYVATGRHLIEASAASGDVTLTMSGEHRRSGHPDESRRFALRLERRFNLAHHDIGAKVRLHLPLPIEDASLRDLTVTPIGSNDKRIEPGRMVASVRVPHDRIGVIAAEIAFTSVMMSRRRKSRSYVIPSVGCTTPLDVIPSVGCTTPLDVIPSVGCTTPLDVIPSVGCTTPLDVIPSIGCTTPLDVIPSVGCTTPLDVIPSVGCTTPLDVIPSVGRKAPGVEGRVEMSADREIYLRPNEGLIQTTPRVSELAKQLGITARDPLESMRSIWTHLFENMFLGVVHYDQLPSENALDWVLDAKLFDCRLGAALIAALCRACGIPARLCSGYALYDIPFYHYWAEVWTDERGWLPFDLICWDLSLRGRDAAWRDRFFGSLDHRMTAEILPHTFTGFPSVGFPEASHALARPMEGGAAFGLFAVDTGALVYEDALSFSTNAGPLLP